MRKLTVDLCLLINAGEIFASWALLADRCPSRRERALLLLNRRFRRQNSQGHFSAANTQPPNISPAFVDRQKSTVNFLTGHCPLAEPFRHLVEGKFVIGMIP